MPKRKTVHSRLLQDAHRAIDRVFSDNTVPPATTKASLEDLADAINMKIECIRHDLREQARREYGGTDPLR